MSTQQSLYVDRRSTARRPQRRQVDRVQLLIALFLLTLAVFGSVQLNDLALTLGR